MAWFTNILLAKETNISIQKPLFIAAITYIHTTCMYIHIYIHTYIHTKIHTNIHTYIHTYIHTRIHTYLYIYIYIYIYIYVYIYIQYILYIQGSIWAYTGVYLVLTSMPNSIFCWLYFNTAFFLSSRLQGRLRVTSKLYIHLQ